MKKRKKSVDISMELTSEEETGLQEAVEREEKFIQIESALSQIGEKCLNLLKFFYYDGLSMKAIAIKVGLKSESVAKNQKYKCLERAKSKIEIL